MKPSLWALHNAPSYIVFPAGGDYMGGSGANSDSFEGGKFADENFAIKHDRRGTIGMANDGNNLSYFHLRLNVL